MPGPLRRLLIAPTALLFACAPTLRPPDPDHELWSLGSEAHQPEGVLSDRITDPELVVHHRHAMGAAFRLVRAVYLLDGAPLFLQLFDQTRPPAAGFRVFEGRIRPGRHTLSVVLEYRGNGSGRFTNVDDYRFKLRSTQVFAVAEGQRAEVIAHAREKGDSATPLPDRAVLDFEVGFRADRDGARPRISPDTAP
ncbi:MAG: hypothetical protein EXR72_00350 [Myxococcales bacterium]|nr:hypothetical protein [Myxococcales bacterium]